MPKEKKQKRITAAQQSKLCDFFEANPEVLRGYKKNPDCMEDVQNKWKKVTTSLNSLGPHRDHKSWPKVKRWYLSNVKSKLKKKTIKWKRKVDGSGPLICNANDFDEMALRMIQVLRKEEEAPESDKNAIHIPNTNERIETFANQKEETESDPDQTSTNDDQSMTEDATDNNSTPFKPHKNAQIVDRKIGDTAAEYKKADPGHHKWSNLIEEPTRGEEDEFDTFGRHIAQQLRSLPLGVALKTQELLLFTVRRERLKLQREPIRSSPAARSTRHNYVYQVKGL
ncbi:uncharacterized protein LOC105393017 isoform X1 [Plutella xylostella]|uniref:uncharacterized protein LOC105393017 isoform X1 n=1 Tax=Plutella xylostella TaxID=51655 RepID=UPI00203306E8|nr:uncharacterized protein LOC105393017 isoform X1 [Plutella xylostella]